MRDFIGKRLLVTSKLSAAAAQWQNYCLAESGPVIDSRHSGPVPTQGREELTPLSVDMWK